MGPLEDHLKYKVKLYELENDRYNYYVTVSTRVGQGWSQGIKIDNGSADTEAEALVEAQKKATEDRHDREEQIAKTKTVVLK
jgi:hypothetical protein